MGKFNRITGLLAGFVISIALLPEVKASADIGVATVELVSPSLGATISLDGPIEVTLRVTGGFASKANDCSLPQGDRSRYVGLIAEIEDENGKKLFWRRSNAGFESFLIFNQARPKIIANGIECTILFNEPNNKNWLPNFYSDVEVSNLINSNTSEDFIFGKVKQLKFTWFIDGILLPSGSRISSIGSSTYNAVPGTKSIINIVDIVRGETIDNKKAFKIVIDVKKGLKVSSLETSESCARPKLESSTNNLDRYIAECVTRVGYPTSRTAALGSYPISAKASISNGEVVTSDNVTVNVGKTELPVVDLVVYVSENGTGIRVKASGRMFLAKDGDVSESVPNQEFKFCSAGVCKTGKSSSTGGISINSDFSAEAVQKLRNISDYVGWTFSAQYKGLDYISSRELLSTNDSASKATSGAIFGSEELPEVANKEVKSVVGFTSLYSQNKVKWGNSINIKYKAVGKGRVLCAAYYQPTATQGIVTFYVTGGKSGTIKIKPWFYKLASYPLQVACASKPGGGLNVGDPRDVYSLGNVTITN
jgi:hypothetical protein